MTTEPSIELKLKKGGHVQRKAMGGMPTGAGMGNRMPMAAMPSERGIPAAARRGVAPKMTVPRGGMLGPMMRKDGGKIEKEIRNESEEIGRVKAKLQKHEMKAASKAHKGLKTGGVIEKYATGGVIQKCATGGVIQKSKKGGLQDDGKAVKYPKVPATKPPYVTKFADTHKKGGRIMKKAYGGAC